MKRKGQGKVCVSFCLLLWIVFSVMGCAESGGSGFLKKEFLKYENFAVLPFEGDDTGEVAKAFARNFQKRFPEISILGGRQFLDNPPEEKLNLYQLDDAMRLKSGCSGPDHGNDLLSGPFELVPSGEDHRYRNGGGIGPFDGSDRFLVRNRYGKSHSLGSREAFPVVSGLKNWQPADPVLYIISLILLIYLKVT
jgi:hypothetical protein